MRPSCPDRREFLKRSIAVAGSLAAVTPALVDPATAAEQRRRRPNLILILADDLGYETLGCNGGTSYKTPNLDRLAATGARFTRAYVQPLCTPTRVQLMTGKSNIRNYIQFGLLDSREVTFANLLKDAGYATCITGKWQLGQSPDLPRSAGFDEHCLWQHLRRPPRYANPGLEINGERKDFDRGEYGPDLVNDYALDFIARKKDFPFFLYYPMMLTHAPYQPTPDSTDWDPKAIGEAVNIKPGHFGDMVAYMDKLIGKLVAKLAELGLHDNTLILFVGDNGTAKGTRSQMGDSVVQGGKGTTTEAGMHVPLVAYGPKMVAAGTVCPDLVDSTDFLPTLLDAAGVKPPSELKLDGRSFLPQLCGEKGDPRKWIYSWYSPRQLPNASMAIREFAFDHRYKLYRNGDFYDLVEDPQEEHPLRVALLEGPAAAAAKRLQATLDRYATARPAELDRRFEAAVQGRNKQKKASEQ